MYIYVCSTNVRKQHGRTDSIKKITEPCPRMDPKHHADTDNELVVNSSPTSLVPVPWDFSTVWELRLHAELSASDAGCFVSMKEYYTVHSLKVLLQEIVADTSVHGKCHYRFRCGCLGCLWCSVVPSSSFGSLAYPDNDDSYPPILAGSRTRITCM